MTIQSRIAFRLPPHLRSEIQAAAAAEGVSISEFSRRALQYRVAVAHEWDQYDIRQDSEPEPEPVIPEPVRSRLTPFFRCPACNRRFLKNRADLVEYLVHYRETHLEGGKPGGGGRGRQV